MTGTAHELNEAERERIAYLAEECGEVVQACMKILRHGWNATDYPDGPASVVHYDNRENLIEELRNVRKAYERMKLEGDLGKENPFRSVKKRKLTNQYFHHQPDYSKT